MRVLFLALLLVSSAWALPQGVEQSAAGSLGGVRVYSWTYPSGELKVKGLLFMPPSEEPLPLVIFSHDGVSGNSKEHRLSCARLAKAGFAVFAPSFRGEDGSQGTIEIAKGEVDDVLNAIPLLSKVPGIDGRRVALAGASHGALVSVLAAARNPDVDCVVEAYGVMDIYRWWAYLKKAGKLGNDDLTRRTYGKGPQDRPQSFAIRHALSVVPRLKAPVLILQGGQDDIVPPEQAELFKAELDRHKKRVVLKIYPDCLHGFLVYAPYLKSGVTRAERAQTDQAWKDMLAFLREHLGNQVGPGAIRRTQYGAPTGESQPRAAVLPSPFQQGAFQTGWKPRRARPGGGRGQVPVDLDGDGRKE
ncbi:MAG: alpha/beta fold hydrolase [Candidatus Eremiobacterota bacterium]